jgi:protein gp37
VARKTFGERHWRMPEIWNAEAKAGGIRRRVFAASMADVFDPEAPEGARARLFATIRATPSLDWLLLTKRPENLLAMLPVGFGPKAWPNVWLGGSVEDQANATRIDRLLEIPATLHFLSVEPLLGPLDLTPWIGRARTEFGWVIVGGESGAKARPFDLAWARALRDQCAATNVLFFLKQLGHRPEADGRPIPLRNPKGDDPSEWPDDLQVRQIPFLA